MKFWDNLAKATKNHHQFQAVVRTCVGIHLNSEQELLLVKATLMFSSKNNLMFLGRLWAILASQEALIIGKSLPIQEPKTKLKSVLQVPKTSITTVPSVTTPMVMPTMVNDKLMKVLASWGMDPTQQVQHMEKGSKRKEFWAFAWTWKKEHSALPWMVNLWESLTKTKN